jgi:hypothetical protein
MTPPKLLDRGITHLEYPIYLCARCPIYNNPDVKMKKEKRGICSCQLSFENSIDIDLTFYGFDFPKCVSYIIIWNKQFIMDYVLPLYTNWVEKEHEWLITKEKSDYTKKIIEYTLANTTDSAFRDIIDYENKVVIDENTFYYPIKVKRMAEIVVFDLEWFKTIIPETSWIYERDCFTIGTESEIIILIPLLEIEEEGSAP